MQGTNLSSTTIPADHLRPHQLMTELKPFYTSYWTVSVYDYNSGSFGLPTFRPPIHFATHLLRSVRLDQCLFLSPDLRCAWSSLLLLLPLALGLFLFFTCTDVVHLYSSALIFRRSYSPFYAECVWARAVIREKVVRLIKSFPQGGWEKSRCGCLQELEAITVQALNKSNTLPLNPLSTVPRFCQWLRALLFIRQTHACLGSACIPSAHLINNPRSS